MATDTGAVRPATPANALGALDDAEWALREMRDPLEAINVALDRLTDFRAALAVPSAAGSAAPRWPDPTPENALALAKARTVIREEAWDEFDEEERGYWIEDSREVLERLSGSEPS